MARSALLAGLFLTGTLPIQAQSVWNLGGNGNWNTAGNWSPVGVPNGSTTDVVIGDGASTITMNLSPAIRNLSIASGNTLSFSNQSDLVVHGTVTNNGLIFVNQTGNSGSTAFQAEANAILSGTGLLRMSRFANGGNSRITSAAGFTLTQQAGHTIAGAGYLNGALINLGVVQADVSQATTGNQLVLDFENKVNQNLLQAAANSILAIDVISITNTGGTIRSLAGSEVQIGNGATIIGGTVESIGTGLIRTYGTANANFRNVTINGRVETNSRGDIGLEGAIHNTGNIRLNPGNATSDTLLEILGTGATLTGGGTITMIGTGNANEASLTGAGGTLTIANQTFEGSGDFGRSLIGIANQSGGLIHANTTGQSMRINANASGFTNQGTLRASNSGTLIIDESFTNDGLIDAQANSLIDVNGVLTNGSGGTIMGSGELDAGATQLINNGNISPGNSAGQLAIDLANLGSMTFGSTARLNIELASASSFDLLAINGEATLNGNLAIDLLGGYLPNASDVFTILTAGNDNELTMGQFFNVAHGQTLFTAGGEGFFTINYLDLNTTSSQVRLSNFTAVPEPASCTVLALAGIISLGLRRRK